MGSIISTTIYQPILLGTATALMIIALIYQKRVCSDQSDEWGKEIFKINMGVSIVIVIAAVIINFISGFEL